MATVAENIVFTDGTIPDGFTLVGGLPVAVDPLLNSWDATDYDVGAGLPAGLTDVVGPWTVQLINGNKAWEYQGAGWGRFCIDSAAADTERFRVDFTTESPAVKESFYAAARNVAYKNCHYRAGHANEHRMYDNIGQLISGTAVPAQDGTSQWRFIWDGTELKLVWVSGSQPRGVGFGFFPQNMPAAAGDDIELYGAKGFAGYSYIVQYTWRSGTCITPELTVPAGWASLDDIPYQHNEVCPAPVEIAVPPYSSWQQVTPAVVSGLGLSSGDPYKLRVSPDNADDMTAQWAMTSCVAVGTESGGAKPYRVRSGAIT
jgi:hypothetical protein